MRTRVEVLAVFPKLLVRDVAASIAFYRNTLGFRVASSFGEPPTFAIIDRDGRGVHLKQGEPRPRRSREDAWDAYFEVRGIDALHAELRGKGARIVRGPELLPYGMREIDVVDPDGYALCFAEDVGTV
jgi:catechol 2,3-dioxygenase-like lactoylglutathione lyase family enzyme